MGITISATDCAEGRWGEGCRQQCKCAGSSLCDPMSGECFCPAGLKGRKCRRECPRGRYGVDCKQVSISGSFVRHHLHVFIKAYKYCRKPKFMYNLFSYRNVNVKTEGRVTV